MGVVFLIHDCICSRFMSGVEILLAIALTFMGMLCAPCALLRRGSALCALNDAQRSRLTTWVADMVGFVEKLLRLSPIVTPVL